MDILLGIVICGIGYWIYRNGKRAGSRKGFAAGRFRRQRQRKER